MAFLAQKFMFGHSRRGRKPYRKSNDRGRRWRAPRRVCVVALSAVIVSLIASVSQTAARTGVFPEPLPARYRTQGRFTTALEQPISASWKGLALRSVLRRLSHDREVSILVDRRVDPDQEIAIDTGDRSLRSAVDEIARSVNLALTRVGNCLLLAPAGPASRLRTLVALREGEYLTWMAGSLPRGYRFTPQRATVAWNDLERPADILSAIGAQFGLSIVGLERIPHDLWAGAAIPEATAAEALSLVLNQFDLTFEWTDRGKGVRFVAIPATICIERTYPLRGKSAKAVLREIRAKVEGIDAEVRAGKLLVRATLEQQEAVAAVLGLVRGGGRPTVKRSTMPLDKQSFTLQARGVSLRELWNELKKQGLDIQYDADSLHKAGIDLEQKVSVDIPNLPAPQFFAHLLEPYHLTYRFNGTTVIVEPK